MVPQGIGQSLVGSSKRRSPRTLAGPDVFAVTSTRDFHHRFLWPESVCEMGKKASRGHVSRVQET